VLQHEATLDFGGVPPGATGSAEVRLANQGDGTCSISGVRLEGCGQEFGQGPGFDAAVVPPGGILSIPVTFRPASVATRTCDLAFDVTDPAEPQRRVSLQGYGDPACLSIQPTALGFALDAAGCGTDESTVAVSNGCGATLQLDSLSLDGPAFLLLSRPPLPVTLAPLESVPVVVGYRPAAPGNHAGTLELGFAGPLRLTRPLAGTAGEGTWRMDHFAQAPPPKVDFLFVIDNGTSMADEASQVVRNLRPFLAELAAQGLDWHVGVTTTGLEPGGECPGGVGGGEDGRLFPVDRSSARVLAPGTPAVETAWEANLQVGACREGPNQVFEAALRALTPPVASDVDDPRHPEPDDGNAGFLRPDAHLSVVAVTDRDDASPRSVGFYRDAFRALKGLDHPERFHFHAFAGGRNGCQREGLGSAEPADRLLSLLEETFDPGVFQSICEPDWSGSVRDSAALPFAFETCWWLTAVPADVDGDGAITDDDGELAVTVDGEPTPSTGAPDRQVWLYSPELNGICFAPRDVPEPGASIDIRYRLPCE
jgi:hypothetical protein